MLKNPVGTAWRARLSLPTRTTLTFAVLALAGMAIMVAHEVFLKNNSDHIYLKCVDRKNAFKWGVHIDKENKKLIVYNGESDTYDLIVTDFEYKGEKDLPGGMWGVIVDRGTLQLTSFNHSKDGSYVNDEHASCNIIQKLNTVI